MNNPFRSRLLKLRYSLIKFILNLIKRIYRGSSSFSLFESGSGLGFVVKTL
jgi:hypothetical protein